MRRVILAVLLTGLCATGGWAQSAALQPWVKMSVSITYAPGFPPAETDDVVIFHDGLVVDQTLFTMPHVDANIVRGTATAQDISNLAISLATNHVRSARDCNILVPPPGKPGFPPDTSVLVTQITWFGRPDDPNVGRGGQSNSFTVTTSANAVAPFCSTEEAAVLNAVGTLYTSVFNRSSTVLREYPPEATPE
jgi:hypothetical protein